MEEKVQRYIDKSREYKNKVIIIVVGNVKEVTKIDEDYVNGTSIVSEYYSLANYTKIVDALIREGFETICYYDEMDFIHDYLTHRIRNNYYKPFIVLNFAQKGLTHGRKSLIPLFCEMNKIAHTNSDPFTSSLVREKYYWNKIVSPHCEKDIQLFDPIHGWLSDRPLRGQKVIAKLEDQCSSMGLSEENCFVYNGDDTFIRALAEKYKNRVVVQKFISGQEVEFPFCYDGEDFFCLKPQGISLGDSYSMSDKILDYNSRKLHNYCFYNFDEYSPILCRTIEQEIKRIAIFLNIQGIGRIDCRIDSENKFYITDVNSNPHLIEIASPAESLRQMGFPDYSSLFNLLIGITIIRHPNQIEQYR
jgi:D-alanine-D-alanine ligase